MKDMYLFWKETMDHSVGVDGCSAWWEDKVVFLGIGSVVCDDWISCVRLG